MIKHILTLIWNKRRKNFLLFLEIFLAFAVLFAVFTFAIQSFRTYSTPLGFDTENSWVAFLDWDEAIDSAALVNMKLQLERELEDKAEIQSISYIGNVTPLSNSMWRTTNDDNGFELSTLIIQCDEDYLETAGLKLVEGRWFNEDDHLGKYSPVVINKMLREDAFGTNKILDSVYTINEEHKFVGVVEHFKYRGEFREEDNLTFFLRPKGSRDLPHIAIRVKPNTPASFEEEVNKTIASVTKRNDFIIVNLDQQREEGSRESWIPLVASLSICGFLIINVALGLFGVLWYTISKRKAEIGLRRTVGATKNRITSQFISEVLMVAAIAIIFGIFFAIQLPLMNVIEDIHNSNYYLSIGFTSLLILTVVLLCAFYPSRQAAGIHPAIALHEE